MEKTYRVVLDLTEEEANWVLGLPDNGNVRMAEKIASKLNLSVAEAVAEDRVPS